MKVDDDLARQVIKPRLRESHKGSYGRVLLVGGLYPYGGAIIMAAIACVNSGAGLVTVATDRDNITALHAISLKPWLLTLGRLKDFLIILGQLMWY